MVALFCRPPVPIHTKTFYCTCPVPDSIILFRYFVFLHIFKSVLFVVFFYLYIFENIKEAVLSCSFSCPTKRKQKLNSIFVFAQVNFISVFTISSLLSCMSVGVVLNEETDEGWISITTSEKVEYGNPVHTGGGRLWQHRDVRTHRVEPGFSQVKVVSMKTWSHLALCWFCYQFQAGCSPEGGGASESESGGCEGEGGEGGGADPGARPEDGAEERQHEGQVGPHSRPQDRRWGEDWAGGQQGGAAVLLLPINVLLCL